MEKQKLPNATAVIVLGILSIITCCCYGIFGLILGIIGLILTNKDLILYNQMPEKFDNYQTLNIGKILCIIGIILSAIAILYVVWFIKMIGIEALKDPVLMQEKIREMQQNLGQ
jgi:hypothetical protein